MTTTQEAAAPTMTTQAAVAQKTEAKDQLDKFLLWLVRNPSRNLYPRPSSSAVPQFKAGTALTVNRTEHVTKLLDKLISEGFLACPVLNRFHRYSGFVDMLDIVSFVVSLAEPESQGPVDVNKLFDRQEFLQARVSDIMKKPNRVSLDPFHAVLGDFSLFNVMETLAWTGTHRVPLIDEEARVVGIVTESMLISLIWQNMPMLGDLINTKVADILPNLPNRLHTIKDSELAITGFKTMAQRNVTGLAVVDNNGILRDTLSIRDLRGIGRKATQFQRLWQPIKMFKAEVRTEFPVQTPATPIMVDTQDTFVQVMRGLDDGNLHRVFVVESKKPEEAKPIHVIEQRAVLLFLLNAAGLQVLPRA